MSKPEVSRAKALCHQCPVQALCLADGLEEDWGVWGGYTRPERERALALLGSKAAVLDALESGLLEAASQLNPS